MHPLKLSGKPLNEETVRKLWEETRERVRVTCDENHNHTALLGCLTGKSSDIIICKLCETILKDRKVVSEALVKLEGMRLQ
jgi:hypothetical protein